MNGTNSLVEICLSHVEIKVQIFYFWKHGRLHGRQIHIQIDMKKYNLKPINIFFWAGGLLHRGQRDLAVFGRDSAAAEQSLCDLVGEIITINFTTHFHWCENS